MDRPPLIKAGILTLVIVVCAVFCWELFVRSKGFDASYDDLPPLWADKRTMIYEPSDKATIFIGSSRIKFDLDVNTWEDITGDHAVQLACVGSTPVPVLVDLANDSNFRGKLVIDVTEGLFFSTSVNNSSTPEKNIKYYHDQTPAQRVSFVLNRVLESQLVFLDKDRLSLNARLAELKIPDRNGVFTEPIFPPDFGRVMFNRQEYMTEKFLGDTIQQNRVRDIWDFFRKLRKDPPVSGSTLDSMIAVVKINVDKIKARGGKVLFVRTPSSGPYLKGENNGYPRTNYWNKLLEYTNCPGIHFADYPAIDHFECPEFSHLSQPDAIVFTKNFIKILSEEKGWAFPKINHQ